MPTIKRVDAIAAILSNVTVDKISGLVVCDE